MHSNNRHRPKSFANCKNTYNKYQYPEVSLTTIKYLEAILLYCLEQLRANCSIDWNAKVVLCIQFPIFQNNIDLIIIKAYSHKWFFKSNNHKLFLNGALYFSVLSILGIFNQKTSLNCNDITIYFGTACLSLELQWPILNEYRGSDESKAEFKDKMKLSDSINQLLLELNRHVSHFLVNMVYRKMFRNIANTKVV